MGDDAKKEIQTPMEMKGVRGYFNDIRIDKNMIPEGFLFQFLQEWENAYESQEKSGIKNCNCRMGSNQQSVYGRIPEVRYQDALM